MSMLTFRATVRPDGTMNVHGVDYDNGRKPLLAWARTDTTLVMRAPGCTSWSGNYQPREYQPVRFYVFKIVRVHTNGDLELDQLMPCFPAARKSKT